VTAVDGDAGRPAYTAIARRWEHGLELHVNGVGVTQSHGMDDAEAMARDYIALSTGADPGSFDVEIISEARTEHGSAPRP